MFWSGMLVGVFIGAGFGILIMALAVSASSDDPVGDDSYLEEDLLFEAGEELVPDESLENETSEDILEGNKTE